MATGHFMLGVVYSRDTTPHKAGMKHRSQQGYDTTHSMTVPCRGQCHIGVQLGYKHRTMHGSGCCLTWPIHLTNNGTHCPIC